jgi:hypothetical protein
VNPYTTWVGLRAIPWEVEKSYATI